MIRKMRLLDPSLLPPTLWEAESETLNIAPSLSMGYERVIERWGLRELGMTRDTKDPPIGGQSREITEKHFAQQFDGSAARAQLALADPKNDLHATSNGILRCLSGNKLTLVDAPCGAGAAALAFLASVAELRAREVLPRLPLDVLLLGGEISEHARLLAEDLLAEIRPTLEGQGIFVTADWKAWDATCPFSTADFIQSIAVSKVTHLSVLLVVSNFSGFLTTNGKWKKAQRQLEQLFLHAYGEANFAVWIEPSSNKVTAPGGLLGWVGKLISSLSSHMPRIGEDADTPEPVATSEAKFRLPLKPGDTARVRLPVMPIDLVRPN